MTIPDDVLVQRVLAGDQEAFGCLVERHKGVVWSLAYNATNHVADAEDLAQEAFLRAYLQLDTLRDGRKFRAWLYSLTRNVCRMWLRSSRRRFEPRPPDVAASPDAEGDDSLSALRRRVMAALNQLSLGRRLAVMLYYIDGLSQADVAGILGVSASAVKSRLHEARKQLKKEAIGLVEGRLRDCEPDSTFTRRLLEVLKDLRAEAPRCAPRQPGNWSGCRAPVRPTR